MKQYRFVAQVILIFLFFPVISHAQQCEDSSINLGRIDEHWLYTNQDIKISFQLPEGWHLFDGVGIEKRYIKIGSDYRKLSEVVVNSIGPVVDLKEIKKYPLDLGLTLFSLAKLEDTAALIPSPNEFQQNKTISCKAYYAETKEADTLLKALYKKLTRSPDTPQIKNGKLGDLEYKYISLAVKNKTGAVENKIFGVRNFRCVNIILRITYITDDDLASINDACKELKIVQ